MKSVTLSRSDRKLLQKGGTGPLGERLAAEEYEGYTRSLAENFDIATKSGSVAEVKTTQSELDNGAAGRFRLFKSQHRELLDRHTGAANAWYVFVVIDVSSGRRNLTAYLKRKKPTSVGSIVGGRGGWYDAGHSAGAEYKLPIDEVFSRTF